MQTLTVSGMPYCGWAGRGWQDEAMTDSPVPEHDAAAYSAAVTLAVHTVEELIRKHGIGVHTAQRLAPAVVDAALQVLPHGQNGQHSRPPPPGGGMTSNPFDDTEVYIDTRGAVRLRSMTFGVNHKLGSQGCGPMLALELGGQVNDGTDETPVQVLFLLDTDGLAALLTEAREFTVRAGLAGELAHRMTARAHIQEAI